MDKKKVKFLISMTAAWSLCSEGVAQKPAVEKQSGATKAPVPMEIKTVYGPGEPVIYYNLTDAEHAVIERVVGFAKMQGAVKGVLGETDEQQAESVEAQSASLVKHEKGFHVYFVDISGDDTHAKFDPDKAFIVVNLAPLKVDDPEKYGRRVERQVMRGLFFYAGRKPCPNPQCALWNYQTNEQLDIIGRGPCPPCLIMGRSALEEKGISVGKTLFPARPHTIPEPTTPKAKK